MTDSPIKPRKYELAAAEFLESWDLLRAYKAAGYYEKLRPGKLKQEAKRVGRSIRFRQALLALAEREHHGTLRMVARGELPATAATASAKVLARVRAFVGVPSPGKGEQAKDNEGESW